MTEQRESCEKPQEANIWVRFFCVLWSGAFGPPYHAAHLVAGPYTSVAGDMMSPVKEPRSKDDERPCLLAADNTGCGGPHPIARHDEKGQWRLVPHAFTDASDYEGKRIEGYSISARPPCSHDRRITPRVPYPFCASAKERQ